VEVRARSVLTAFFLAGASYGASKLWRNRPGRNPEHVDLYFEDGSMLSFAGGSGEAERLLPLARRVLSAARGL
jgi:hypothetical protein